MEEPKITELLQKLMDELSDRNSCLTVLAQSRLSLMQDLGRMSFNGGNDQNGNKEKWQQMKEQVEKIDQLIRDVADTMFLSNR